MIKKIIGKKIELSIGAKPTTKKEDNEIVVGSSTTLHLSEEEAKKYDKIIGEEINITIGNEIDDQVRNILDVINKTDEKEKDKIKQICQQILEAHDEFKLSWTKELINIGKKIISISSLVLKLSEIIKNTI